MTQVQIYKQGAIVGRSRNLRGIADRARKVGLDAINITRVSADDDLQIGAIVSFWFADGSWSVVNFADYTVASAYATKRQARWACTVSGADDLN